MTKSNKNSIIAALAVSFILGLTGPISAFAATTPSLGEAVTYGVLGSTYSNTTVTTINGDVGFTTGPAVAPLGVHTNYGSGAPYATAGTDQGDALTNLNGQTCTFTFTPGAINLSTDTTHGPIGIYTPGVYCSTGAMDVGGPLALNGSGTYIFRPVGALTSPAGAVITSTNASACDVFWTPAAAMTLGANNTFMGTVIGNAGITVGANTTWIGRALSFGGTVTTDTDTITAPTCTSPSVPATLHVIKQVINDNSGTTTISSFNLHVKISGTDVAGSPAAGTAAPGTSYSLSPGTYIVSEDTNASYVSSFSGDCDSSGSVTLSAGANKTCTITNNDILPPPPTPLKECKLEIQKQVDKSIANPGDTVTYTIAFKNIGTANCTGGGVRVTDTAYALLTFLDESHSANVVAGYGSKPLYTEATRLLIWNADTLTPNESGWVKWRARVNSAVSCGNFEIPNTAKITALELSNFQTLISSNTVKTTGTKYCPLSALNLIQNPSFEINGGNGNPQNWLRGGWGTNTRTFTYPTIGSDGNKAVKVAITNYTSGDAKWYFKDVPIVGGKTYTFSDSYKSNVKNEIGVFYKTPSGTRYQFLTTLPASPAWTNVTRQITVPANAIALTVFHTIYSVGYLELDSFSLTQVN
ncbi:MAG: ice-binding family protein [bacterium]|nr:ice-binding family protein [bacterium]